MTSTQRVFQPRFSCSGSTDFDSRLVFITELDTKRALQVARDCAAAGLARDGAKLQALPRERTRMCSAEPERYTLYVISGETQRGVEFTGLSQMDEKWIEFNLGHQVEGYSQETLKHALRVLRARNSCAPFFQ